MAKNEKPAKEKSTETAAEFTPIGEPPAPAVDPSSIEPRRIPLESYPQFLGKEEWERQMAAKVVYPIIIGLMPLKTAEQWAEAKGMLPEFIPLPQPFARADAPVVMQHNPQSWRYAATRAGSGWPIGKELTEAEFDAAVTNATTGHQYR